MKASLHDLLHPVPDEPLLFADFYQAITGFSISGKQRKTKWERLASVPDGHPNPGDLIVPFLDFVCGAFVAKGASKTLFTRCGISYPVSTSTLCQLRDSYGIRSNLNSDDVRASLMSHLETVVPNANRHSIRESEFYTPLEYVVYAYTMFRGEVGEDWPESTLVWDASCGTGNLTSHRVFRVRQQIQTTLHSSDIDLIGHVFGPPNRQSARFQHDFLASFEIPERARKLMMSMESSRLLMLNNPPYNGGSSWKLSDTSTDEQSGVNRTGVRDAMHSYRANGTTLGKMSKQLSGQFVFKLTQLHRRNPWLREAFPDGIYIGLFLPATFWVGQYAHDYLRQDVLKEWRCVDGFLFSSIEFRSMSRRSLTWPVSFTLWKLRDLSEIAEQDAPRVIPFYFRLYERCGEEGDIVESGTVVLESMPLSEGARNWTQQTQRWLGNEERQFAVPIRTHHTYATKTPGTTEYTLPVEAIGYLNAGGNLMNGNIRQNNLLASIYSNMHGFPIRRSKRSVRLALVFYAIRRAMHMSNIDVTDFWKVSAMQYRKPSFKKHLHRQWKVFCYDCIVYALTDISHAHLPSTGGKEVTWTGSKGETRRATIRNEFSITSISHARAKLPESLVLAETKDRFLVRKLLTRDRQKRFLSPAARSTLAAAREQLLTLLAEKTDGHVGGWDAGLDQVVRRGADVSKAVHSGRALLQARIRRGLFKFGFLPPENEGLVLRL